MTLSVEPVLPVTRLGPQEVVTDDSLNEGSVCASAALVGAAKAIAPVSQKTFIS